MENQIKQENDDQLYHNLEHRYMTLHKDYENIHQENNVLKSNYLCWSVSSPLTAFSHRKSNKYGRRNIKFKKHSCLNEL
jgi:hypothetical protein